ncbi:hypothetical protein Taro_031560, partial [Colocasia esculenta]|nr:hypothetical protein [Colocasia esculenta]
AEYVETVRRCYHTVTGRLISTGQSETFLQRAIQEQGEGQVMDSITEIQKRHDAVKEIEKSLMDLHQVFLDMATLVEAQGQQLNDIECNVSHASSFVHRGTEQLEVAREYQKSSRKWTCIDISPWAPASSSSSSFPSSRPSPSTIDRTLLLQQRS